VARVKNELQEGKMAIPKQRTDLFSTKLLKVAERARRDPETRFTFFDSVDRTALLERIWSRGATRKASLRRSSRLVAEGCRRHRHLLVKDQHAALTRRIEGDLNR
jgi:hypothetical protein